MRRVYVETSVWSMTAPNQESALRGPTIEFLERCKRRVVLPCISAVVAAEVARAPSDARTAILRHMTEISPVLLPADEQVEMLARRFIEQRVLSDRRLDDARHVACAFVNDVDLLVSWNYRHIANVRKSERFNAVAVLAGLTSWLAIHSPLEVVEWE